MTYTLFSLYNNCNLCFQLFPLFFVLMMRKDTKSYENVFKYIEDNVFKFRAAQFMADFEKGLRKAISNYFTGTPLYGCWYHYCASVRRRLMTLHMHRVITDDPAASVIYRMLLSLPLLSRERIQDGFAFIEKEARRTFKEFFKYFNEFWINLVCKENSTFFCDISNFKFDLMIIDNTEQDELSVRCIFGQPYLVTIGITKFDS